METSAHVRVSNGDPDTELVAPENDVVDPVVSIVVPAADEELTVATFVAWCHEGLARAGAKGEILIVDSSTDRTAALAHGAGARVLKCPRRGLGRAYIDALPYIRGKYVIMGDADCTYDFRELAPFVKALEDGAEFVMGSRRRGAIEPGSMPLSHRFFGSPITTWALNRIYGSRFTDIHCGMRAIRREALDCMGLSSQSWEYASEMVLKSVRMKLRTSEVPVVFYKDRDGRVSHHKRAGVLSPVQAAWANLRTMFVYRPEFFALKPGVVMFVLGLVFTLPLSFGSISIGPVTFDLYWMLFGLTMAVLGLQSFFFGCIAQIFCDYSNQARARWMKTFRYTRTVLISVGVTAAGIAMLGILIDWYFAHGLKLAPAQSWVDHIGVIGILFVVVGFSTFCFTLVLYATDIRFGEARELT